MRHLRMVGLCLVAAFVVSAVAALPALASSPKKIEETGVNALKASCPTENPEVGVCFVGITNGGSNGGFFQIGTARVPLNKPITIQGGLREGQKFVVPPANGKETLEAPPLKVLKGIKLITPRIEQTG